MKKVYFNLIKVICIPSLIILIKIVYQKNLLNKDLQPIIGEPISKAEYSVWDDQWPFKVDKGILFCLNIKENYYIYFKTTQNTYALNKATKDKFDFSYPFEIWRKHPDQNLARYDVRMDFNQLIDRAKSNCNSLKNSY